MTFVRPCDHTEDVIKHVSGILNFEGTTDLVGTQKEMRRYFMEPIISPCIIYLFSVLTKLNTISFTIALFSWATIFFIALDKIIYGDDMEIEFNYKYAIIVAVIATIIVILIPDEKTMLAMLTLSFITPDNVVIAENHIIELVTKIMDVVNNK